jgi:hypothetical protein
MKHSTLAKVQGGCVRIAGADVKAYESVAAG